MIASNTTIVVHSSNAVLPPKHKYLAQLYWSISQHQILHWAIAQMIEAVVSFQPYKDALILYISLMLILVTSY